MIGAPLPLYMPMVPMAQPYPQPFGYLYVDGNVGVNGILREV